MSDWRDSARCIGTDPEQVAAAITDPDEWEDFLRSHRTVNDWFTKVREARPARLRLIGGSQ